MARKKKDNIEQNEQNDIQLKESKEQNKDIIVQDNVPRALSRDSRTLEQKLNSYKRKLRKI